MTETPETPAAKITADAIAAQIGGQMNEPDSPPPKPAATNHGPAKPADVLPPEASVTMPDGSRVPLATAKDKHGRAFDPTKFRPEFDSAGRWKNANAGRGGRAARMGAAPGSQSYIPDPKAPHTSAPAPEGAAEAPPPAAAVDRYTMLADVYCRGGVAIAVGTISDEWAPDNDAEFVALRDFVAAWFRAEGWDELSPRAAAFAAVATYAFKRAGRPKTQSRLAGLVAWFRAWRRGRSVSARVDSYPQPEGAK